MSGLDTAIDLSLPAARNNFFDLTGNDDDHRKKGDASELSRLADCFYDLTGDDDDDDDDDGKKEADETNGEVTFLLSVPPEEPKLPTVQQEEAAMTSSTMGRSVILARRIIELHGSNQFPQVEPLSRDEMVFLANQFFECQEYFERGGIPSLATIAYHYTARQSLDSIKETGLLTPNDQKSQHITTGRCTGAGTYGSGIYVGSNPYAFCGYGAGCGLVVAVLLGKMRRVSNASDGTQFGKTHNTVVGNKVRAWTNAMDEAGHYSDEYVLQQSRQCLPLLKFQREPQPDVAPSGSETMWQLHQGVQAILDELLNRGQPTKLVKIFPTNGGNDVGALGGVSLDQERFLTRAGAATTRGGVAGKVRRRDPPDRVDGAIVPEEFYTLVARRSVLADDCHLCQEPLASRKKVVSLRHCHHCFHEECLKAVFVSTFGPNTCPQCHAPLKRRRLP